MNLLLIFITHNRRIKCPLKSFRSWIFILSILCFIPTQTHAAKWVRALVVPSSGAKVFKEPKPESKSLGVYPKNTAMLVSEQKKNGFYAIDLKKNWNGVRYLWIAAADVKIEQKSDNQSRSIAGSDSISDSMSSRKNPAKPWSLEPSLGYSSVLIQQTRFPNNSVTFLTGQLAFSYLFTKTWEATGQVSSTLTAISRSQSQYSAQFLNGDARLGFKFFIGPTLLNLAVGCYYSNFITSNASYGYNPFFNPELVPRVTFGLGGKFAASVWGRYVADLYNSFSTLEITWSAGISYAILPEHPISLFLTSSNLSTGVLSSNGINISTTLIGVNYLL